MADERDPKVSQRYREHGAEEPSPALDQKILAASRRAAEKPHAPLVTPVGRHRWYFSLAAAAILVLAVAVTVHMQREQPDPEVVPTAPLPQGQKKAPPVKASPEPQAGRVREEARSAGSAPAVPAAQSELMESPERWLERIAQLRKEGRHEEADKALAEFRRRYPDYRIPEAMLEKVEKK